MGADQFDAVIIEVLQRTAAAVGSACAGDGERACSGVVEGDTGIGSAGIDALEGDASRANGGICEVNGRFVAYIYCVACAGNV